MDDFFNKIKKKLSVDNIVDLMKDGKLKEEIKQTLTAGVNLNEKPKPDDFRACLEVSSIDHCTEVGQSDIQSNENDEKPDPRPSLTVASILEPEVQVTKKSSYPKTTEEINLRESSEEKLTVEVINLNEEKPIAAEETSKITDEKIELIKENTKNQTDDTKLDEIDTINVNSKVLQKPVVSQSELENSDKINFEMFLG